MAGLIVVMMFGIGLRTDPRDFRRAAARPGWFAVHLLVNFALVPLVMVGAMALIEPTRPVMVAMVLCAAAPGGAIGALFAGMAKGDLASSVSAMVMLSAVAVFVSPPLIALWLGGEGDMAASGLIWPMMRALLVFQLSPMFVGMVIRAVRRPLADRMAGPAQMLSTVVLGLVVVGMLVAKGHVLSSIGWQGTLLSVILIVSALLLGAAGAPADRWRRGFAIVAASRNIALALMLSSMWFPDPLTDATILGFGLWAMIVPIGAARWWAKTYP